jgi:hypothetical protein
MAGALRTLDNFISGNRVASTGDNLRTIVSPVTGESIADAPDASAADVERAVVSARTAQPKWAALSAWHRSKIAVHLLHGHREGQARNHQIDQPLRLGPADLSKRSCGTSRPLSLPSPFVSASSATHGLA